jgi:hypothetical protein
MIDTKGLRGLLSPVVTPFEKDLGELGKRGFEMPGLAAPAEA